MNDRDDARWIQKDEERAGPFTVQQLYRMVERAEIDNHTPFWSERLKTWLPLTHLICDMYPTDDKLKLMRDSGVKRVKVFGWDPGWDERDCEACRKLIGRAYPIDAAPELPPEGCNCTPWCGSLILPGDEQDKLFVRPRSP